MLQPCYSHATAMAMSPSRSACAKFRLKVGIDLRHLAPEDIQGMFPDGFDWGDIYLPQTGHGSTTFRTCAHLKQEKHIRNQFMGFRSLDSWLWDLGYSQRHGCSLSLGTDLKWTSMPQKDSDPFGSSYGSNPVNQCQPTSLWILKSPPCDENWVLAQPYPSCTSLINLFEASLVDLGSCHKSWGSAAPCGWWFLSSELERSHPPTVIVPS